MLPRRLSAAFDVVATLLMIVVTGALLWRLYHVPAPPAPPQRVEKLQGVTLAADKISETRGGGRLVLIEFGDYECPFCARHNDTTAPRIKKEFVDTGVVQQAFLNFPLDIHPRAQKGAEALECAGRQHRFWEMHDRLIANPKALEPASLKQHATAIGLNDRLFAECLDTGLAAEQVRLDREEGNRLGVTGTPAFFIGVRRADGSIELATRLRGAVPFAEFEKAIHELLGNGRASSVSRSSRVS